MDGTRTLGVWFPSRREKFHVYKPSPTHLGMAHRRAAARGTRKPQVSHTLYSEEGPNTCQAHSNRIGLPKTPIRVSFSEWPGYEDPDLPFVRFGNGG